MRKPEYVWMIEDNCRAELLSYGAFASVVRFTLLGHVHEVVVSNEEFEFIGKDDSDDED